MSVPDWLKKPQSLQNHAPLGRRRSADFVNKTVNGLVSVIKEAVFSEKFAGRPGLLQSFDPRVKLASILALVVTLSFVRQIEVVVGVYIVILAIALLSKVELVFYIKRVWLFIPLFTAAIALPATLNLVTPGQELVVLLHLSRSYVVGPVAIPTTISITQPGVYGTVLFTIRTAASVSLVVLLTLTTRWNDLLRALKVFRLPEILVSVLGMTYRYVFLLLRTTEEMHLARKSRSVSQQTGRQGRSWVASRIIALIKKSLSLSEGVHAAMVARGFSGEPKSLKAMAVTARDVAWLATSLLTCVLILAWAL